MDDEARSAVVTALIKLAGSPDHRDRADAGRCLAGFAGMPGTRGPLLDLVLDADDTFVTRVTAEALLRRRDAVGLGLVAAAVAVADPNHADWIGTAVVDVFGVFARDRDAAVLVCEALAEGADEQVRAGVPHLVAVLTDLDPVLHPV